MMTAEQEIADALCELKTIRADYRAMSEAWRRDKRAIIDICVAHADIRTLQAILDHLEKSCDWTRWPAEPPGLRAPRGRLGDWPQRANVWRKATNPGTGGAATKR